VFTARYGLKLCILFCVLPTAEFMCFVWISEQAAIISLYSINCLVFITWIECVYCAVRTEALYIILRSTHTAEFICFVWIPEQTAITRISLYSINWLVFISETEFVYCAVRTGCWNKSVYALPWRSNVLLTISSAANRKLLPASGI
jgi:hypothetical protein